MEDSARDATTYVHWIRRFIVFHHKKHPSTMGAPEIEAFLSWLATGQRVSASTQNHALSALLFLYRHVLRIEVGAIEQVPRAKMPHRVPVVLSREEVSKILKHIQGTMWIVVALLYGAGLFPSPTDSGLGSCRIRAPGLLPSVHCSRLQRTTALAANHGEPVAAAPTVSLSLFKIPRRVRP